MEKPVLSCLPPARNYFFACVCHLSQPLSSGILFQPIGLRRSPSYWSCATIILSASSPNNQWLHGPMRTVPFRPTKLWGFGVLICMRMNQSRTRGQRRLCKSANLQLRECTFSFHQRLFPWLELKHSRAEWSRTMQSTVDWTRSHQNCLVGGSAVPLHNWAVTLLSVSTVTLFSRQCCITMELLALNKISFFTTKLGVPDCAELASVTTVDMFNHSWNNKC